MTTETHTTEVVIAGGGLAGLSTAYELLDLGKTVLLLDKDEQENLGGMAKKSFGGVHMIGTPHQKRSGIEDSPDAAFEDWLAYAEFGPGDDLPRQWAKYYCENSRELIFDFLDQKKVSFLPIVNWPERGTGNGGNRVARWHITWGTGYEIIHRLLRALDAHPNRDKLQILFEHEVSGVETTDGRVTGLHGKRLGDSQYRVEAEHVVLAAGGMCGGDMSMLKKNWYPAWGEPPKVLLNGAHQYGDGMLHEKVRELGGVVTHLDKQWHYAAGVHNPAKSRPFDGLSIVPPRSALWVNALGERIRNPGPLVAYTDTRHLVESILKQPGKYSWQVMNWKIAIKELAVSGCNYMDAFRYKKRLLLVKHLLFGNKDLIRKLAAECPDDIVMADSLEELVKRMNERNLDGLVVDGDVLQREIDAYDADVDRGPGAFEDEQLQLIEEFRKYRGDRARLCKFQKIADPKARPFVAVREFILARKSLGGVQTDLSCRVLKEDGTAIPGLYAVGETAGFGGGGIHGLRSLEGTFLGGCVLTGRVAGRAIARG